MPATISRGQLQMLMDQADRKAKELHQSWNRYRKHFYPPPTAQGILQKVAERRHLRNITKLPADDYMAASAEIQRHELESSR